MTQCRDVKKLFAAVDVLIGLVGFTGPVRASTLCFLLRLLAHKYPRVRKYTAEQLYTKLLVSDEIWPTARTDEVLEILSCVEWDAELDDARQQRDKIAALGEISLPKSQ